MRHLLSAAFIAAHLVACSESAPENSDGATGGGAGGASAGAALCKEERVGLEGELEGESVSVDVLWDGWIYDGPGGVLTINFAGGALDLKPATATSSDVGPVDVDGLLTMPSGTPRAGETLCVDEATLLVCDGTGSDECTQLPRFTFELAKLSTSPDGKCPGTPIAGKLVGCMVATSQ